MLVDGLDGVGVLGPFVTSFNGCSGTTISRNANIVAEGGVFSPINGLGGGLVEGRSVGVSLSGSLRSREGVGVPDGSRSKGEGEVTMLSLLFCRPKLALEVGLSGDLSGLLLSR